HRIDGPAQRARRGGRIGIKRQRRDDGDTLGAGPDHSAGVARIDAGDAADRQLLVALAGAAPEYGDDARKPLRPDRRILLLLRQGHVNAAGTDIVDQLDRRRFGFADVLDRQADDGAGPEQPPRIGSRHVVLTEMHAVSTRRERHVDPVVDHERHGEWRQCLFDGARFVDHGARFAVLVAQLNERRTALGAQPRQFGKLAAVGTFRIDDGVEAKIDFHQETFRRARKVVRSRLCRASMIQLANRPGPCAASAATSPATPSTIRAALVASHASVSTASAAQTSADPAQPIPVTSAINGSPLAMTARLAPSVTMSLSPVSATTVPQASATRAATLSAGSPPNSGPNSAALSRTTAGPRARSSRANAVRPGERSMKTGSSTHGMRAVPAASSATAMARRRSSSKVPRLTRSASAPATKLTMSSGEMVIDGTAPAASSMLAV